MNCGWLKLIQVVARYEVRFGTWEVNSSIERAKWDRLKQYYANDTYSQLSS